MSDHGTMDRRYRCMYIDLVYSKVHTISLIVNIEQSGGSPVSRELSSPTRCIDVTLKRNQKGFMIILFVMI